MFDEPMVQFLHSGCALLVGTVDAAGTPHGGRAHGLTVLGQRPVRVRLLVDHADTKTVANLQPGALVAITACNVPTLRSLQLKGRVELVEPATPADEAKRAQYATDFARDIHETDGDPMAVLERWVDRRVVACVVEVDEVFDQTPGPAAGAPLRTAT